MFEQKQACFDPNRPGCKAEARKTKLKHAKQNIKDIPKSLSSKSNYNILISKNISIQLISVGGFKLACGKSVMKVDLGTLCGLINHRLPLISGRDFLPVFLSQRN